MRHFSEVRRRLGTKFGAGVPVECGVTAEAVESDFEFENVDSLSAITPCASSMYRLHFEVDADNISDDHVLFAYAEKDCLIMLHSYAGIHPVRMERRKWEWITRAVRMCETNNAKEWIRLFSLQRTPPKFLMPMNISCHCSKAYL